MTGSHITRPSFPYAELLFFFYPDGKWMHIYFVTWTVRKRRKMWMISTAVFNRLNNIFFLFRKLPRNRINWMNYIQSRKFRCSHDIFLVATDSYWGIVVCLESHLSTLCMVFIWYHAPDSNSNHIFIVYIRLWTRSLGRFGRYSKFLFLCSYRSSCRKAFIWNGLKWMQKWKWEII